jgi:hypothetical protein
MTGVPFIPKIKSFAYIATAAILVIASTENTLISRTSSRAGVDQAAQVVNRAGKADKIQRAESSLPIMRRPVGSPNLQDQNILVADNAAKTSGGAA